MPSTIAFGVNLHPYSMFPSVDSMVEFVQRAERLGYTYAIIPEHLAFPTRFERVIGKEWWDPIVLATYLAARTTSIEFVYGVLPLPQHNPFLLAKQLASLDHVTRGRVGVGIGVGWMREELELLGVEFRRRGKVTDEQIGVMRALWTTDPAEFAGTDYSFSDISFHPKPFTVGGPRIYVGGNVDRAVRRAGLLGDGWMPLNTTREKLATGLGTIKALRAERNLSLDGFRVFHTVSSMDWRASYNDREAATRDDAKRTLELVHEWAHHGVTHFRPQLPSEHPELTWTIEAFAEEVVSQASRH